MKKIGDVRAVVVSGVLLASMAGCSGTTTLGQAVAPSSTPTPAAKAVMLKECDLLTDSDFGSSIFATLEDAGAIHTRPADAGGWLTECQYGVPDTASYPADPEPAFLQIYVDSNWDDLWKQFETPDPEAGPPKPIKDFGADAWIKSDADGPVEVLARKGNAVLIVRNTQSVPSKHLIEIATLVWTRLPERSRVETDDLGAACGKVDRKAAEQFLGRELPGAREFRTELDDTACTFNGPDNARIIVNASTNSLTLSTFANNFDDKEWRVTSIGFDAIARNFKPDHFDVRVGKRIISIWVFWPDDTSDADIKDATPHEVAFLQSTAKLFANVPS